MFCVSTKEQQYKFILDSILGFCSAQAHWSKPGFETDFSEVLHSTDLLKVLFSVVFSAGLGYRIRPDLFQS